MQCWICASPANGTCRFCGRAVCREDAKTQPFVLEVYPSDGALYGLAVEDALHCGVCKPRPEPVLMDFLASPKTPKSDKRHRPSVTSDASPRPASADTPTDDSSTRRR
jgi:hypothetical protein